MVSALRYLKRERDEAWERFYLACNWREDLGLTRALMHKWEASCARVEALERVIGLGPDTWTQFNHYMTGIEGTEGPHKGYSPAGNGRATFGARLPMGTGLYDAPNSKRAPVHAPPQPRPQPLAPIKPTDANLRWNRAAQKGDSLPQGLDYGEGGWSE